MRSIIIIFLCSFVLSANNWVDFISREYYDEVPVKEYFTFVDWDNDGLDDIVCTEDNFPNSKFSLLLLKKNIGTIAAPEFSTGVPILKENGDTLLFENG